MLVEKSTIAKLRISGKAETIRKTRKDREGRINYGITLESNDSGIFASLIKVTEEIYGSVSVGDEVHLILFKEE